MIRYFRSKTLSSFLYVVTTENKPIYFIDMKTDSIPMKTSRTMSNILGSKYFEELNLNQVKELMASYQ